MAEIRQPRTTATASTRSVSRETLERLDVFAGLVGRWNSRLNLVSSGDAADLWSRHIADSLQFAPLIPDSAGSGVDIGSGAGFPGLVLAIVTNRPFHLVEADHRKAAFLREAARITQAPALVQPCRIEATQHQTPLVTARAVARLSRLLGWTYPLLIESGCCLFAKGRSVAVEMFEAEQKWRFRVETYSSATHHSGVLLRIWDIRPR